jgi:hypothetical protein
MPDFVDNVDYSLPYDLPTGVMHLSTASEIAFLRAVRCSAVFSWASKQAHFPKAVHIRQILTDITHRRESDVNLHRGTTGLPFMPTEQPTMLQGIELCGCPLQAIRGNGPAREEAPEQCHGRELLCREWIPPEGHAAGMRVMYTAPPVMYSAAHVCAFQPEPGAVVVRTSDVHVEL